MRVSFFFGFLPRFAEVGWLWNSKTPTSPYIQPSFTAFRVLCVLPPTPPFCWTMGANNLYCQCSLPFLEDVYLGSYSTFADLLHWLHNWFFFYSWILFCPASGCKMAYFSILSWRAYWSFPRISNYNKGCSRQPLCTVLHVDMWLLDAMVGLYRVLKDIGFFHSICAMLSPVNHKGALFELHSICAHYIWIHDPNVSGNSTRSTLKVLTKPNLCYLYCQ